MRRLIPALVVLAALLTSCRSAPDYGRPLPPGAPALLPLSPGELPPDFSLDWYERDEILPALDRSIAWTKREGAARHFPIAGIRWERARASLERFREILTESRGAEEFAARLEAEFTVYKSAGWDGRGGGVLFTGYYTPILSGSRVEGPGWRHPLFALPEDLVKGADGAILGRRTAAGIEPYPTRRAIEASGLLADRELELVWLGDPLDAFIAHVNGSAFVELPDGELARFGYAGKNGRQYTSLGGELVREAELEAEELSLFAIRDWAGRHPDRLGEYLDRNDSFVFFTPIEGNPRGSLGLEVAAGRTLATDKSLFPRGALTWVHASLPTDGSGRRRFDRFLLDQDTGGAIRTAGRADIYLGVGEEAEQMAGRTRSEGQLYYLFLSE